MQIEFPSPPDAATKQTLRQAVSVAEAHGLGLSIRVALDPAGQTVLLIESLPAPDCRTDGVRGDDGADEGTPPP